jgi:hypothetical protein
MTDTALPVPVLQHPHWRVNVRPEHHNPELLPTLSACLETVRATKLSLRGWDFPHISNKPGQTTTGRNWVASFGEFMSHVEYWRFYQSGQFLYLGAVREALSKEWISQLRGAAQAHASWRTDVNWEQVPGFFSLLNFLYTVTEIFEFPARLAQRGIYAGQVSITIELKRVKGFVLTPEIDRAWSDVRATTEDTIGRTWTVDSRELLASSADISLAATAWFFERFNWLDPSVDVLKKDQQKFLAGRY